MLTFAAIKPYMARWTVPSLRFVVSQAHGIPSGPHGELARSQWRLFIAMTYRSRYNIDGVSMTFHPPRFNERGDSILKVMASIENLLRSLNNLNEHLHQVSCILISTSFALNCPQSFYYYIASGKNRYIPIGDYMIVFGMLIAGTALYVCSHLLHFSCTAT